MRAIRSLTLILSLAALALPVHAEEPNGDDSAAARLFREGWWLETGAGALDQAAAKYRAALAAEGSTTIRARALYRMGVVLHRMGRTAEGIQALERLAKEFRSQTELLAEATKRLEEWTGQDLKASFGEWYRRYQYSPEFQAKVIDLVLKLGMGNIDFKARNAAEQELLTIGEPAIPALRAHAGSSNGHLSATASRLLFRLGSVPPPEALVVATSWTDRPSQVALVLEGDAATRLAIRQALAEDDRLSARMLRAAATGRLALVEEFLGQDKTTSPALGRLLRWGMDTDVSPQLLARVKALIEDPDAHVSRRAFAVSALHATRGQVTAAELRDWTQSGDPGVRDSALQQAMGEGVDRSHLWKTYVALIEETDPNASDMKRWVQSLIHVVRHAPATADLAAAAEAIASRLRWNTVTTALTGRGGHEYNANPRGRRLLEQVIETASDDNASRYVKRYVEFEPDSARVGDRLLAWSRSARSANVRWMALKYAALRLTGDPEPLLRAAEESPDVGKASSALFDGLRANPRVADLPWTQPRLEQLLRLASATRIQNVSNLGQVRSTLPGASRTVLAQLHDDADVRPLLRAAVGQAPERVPEAVVQALSLSLSVRPGDEPPLGVSLLESYWATWTSEARRIAGIERFGDAQLNPGDRKPLIAFAKAQLARGPEAYSLAVRRALLDLLSDSQRTLEAVQAAFDLTDPEQLEVAVHSQLRFLPRDLATYEAFLHALDKPSAPGTAHAFDSLFRPSWGARGVPESRRLAHIQRALRRGDEAGAQIAHHHLQVRGSTEDMPLWYTLLRQGDESLRLQVVRTLGSLYRKDTIAELARLVDDPKPLIRDAALKSLERIKTIEEQKDYWRAFAEEKGK